jgi:hypothetical protein
VQPAADADLVARRSDLAHQAGGAVGLAAEQEEGGARSALVEQPQEERGGQAIRSVVEGERDVVRAAPAGQAGHEAVAQRAEGGDDRSGVGRGESGDGQGGSSRFEARSIPPTSSRSSRGSLFPARRQKGER